MFEPLFQKGVPARLRRRLVPEEIGALVDAVVQTARSLAADAALLLASERFPRAAALAVLALEEVGKIKIMARILSAPDDAELRAAWNEFYAHPAKVVANVEVAIAGLSEEEKAALKASYGREFDTLKQLAFYSNFVNGRGWIRPESAVTRNDASLLVTLAQHMVGQLGTWEAQHRDHFIPPGAERSGNSA